MLCIRRHQKRFDNYVYRDFLVRDGVIGGIMLRYTCSPVNQSSSKDGIPTIMIVTYNDVVMLLSPAIQISRLLLRMRRMYVASIRLDLH